MRVLVLGASYGALLGCKLNMAGHDATLVCLPEEAELINEKGYEVRIRLRGEDDHRALRSADQPGRLDATTPAEASPEDLDRALMQALAGRSLKDAVAAVTEATGLPRKQVYARALEMAGK